MQVSKYISFAPKNKDNLSIRAKKGKRKTKRKIERGNAARIKRNQRLSGELVKKYYHIKTRP